MGITLSRFENNWKFGIEERWRVKDKEHFDYVVAVLSAYGIKFSVEYPAHPYKEIRDVVIRETRVYQGVDKAQELMSRLIDLKARYNIVFRK